MLIPHDIFPVACGNRTGRGMLFLCLAAAFALSFAVAGHAGGTRDQGRIFGTGGVVNITTDMLAQSITAGTNGQLTGIQIQWNAPIPIPGPNLDLSIVAGGNPLEGETLYSEQLKLDPELHPDDSLFTWDLADADLFFEAGDRFCFTLSADRPGLVIAGNDPPGYAGGSLTRSGAALPANQVNDIAFITFVAGDGAGDTAASDGAGDTAVGDGTGGGAAGGRDQGRIFGTDDVVPITRSILSQSITAAITGQLTGIQIQWNAEVPRAAPPLHLAIFRGGNPPRGNALYTETLDLGSVRDSDVYAWDLSGADLFFQAGEQFTFTLRADREGFVIAANDPPGYAGGELFIDGEARSPDKANDIAFITYVNQPHPIPHPLTQDPLPPSQDQGPLEEPPELEIAHGLVIAANDPPGYKGGELFRNGLPRSADAPNDIAFITFMGRRDTAGAATRDQGRIFGTHDVVPLTSDTLSQSITAGIAGQLIRIQMQWNADIPEPAPLLNLSIVAGGNPPVGKTLHSGRIDPVPSPDEGLFNWDVSEAQLFFEKGEQFTLTLSTEMPLRDIRVASVRHLGAVENDAGVLMRDCGYSARFGGKSVWFFGDTVLETPNVDNLKVLCNSWSATLDIDAGDGLANFEPPVDEIGAPLPLIPLTEEEESFNREHAHKDCQKEPCGARWAIWPGAIVVDEEADIAYIFYHKIYTEPGAFNFLNIGHSIAVWKNFDQPVERPEFGYYEDYPTLFFSEERDGFGSAAVLVDGKIYVYGCELLPDDVMKPCRLARVDLDKVLDRSSWEFYQGQGLWSPQLDGAARIFHGSDMMTVFYSNYLSRYVVVYSLPLDTRVMMRVAERPEGPWSEPLKLFRGRTSQTSTGWIYDALAHPEFSEDGRTIYITYSRQIGPWRSQLQLMAVDLELKP